MENLAGGHLRAVSDIRRQQHLIGGSRAADAHFPTICRRCCSMFSVEIQTVLVCEQVRLDPTVAGVQAVNFSLKQGGLPPIRQVGDNTRCS